MSMQEFEIEKDKELSQKLEEKYQKGELSVTGRVVTDRIPTNLVEEQVAKKLEESYQRGQIEGIETTYFVDSRVAYTVPVQEYEYNGKKYARVKAEFGTNTTNLKFSNGQEIISGQYWLHVEPLMKEYEKNNQVIITQGIAQEIEEEYAYNGEMFTRVKAGSQGPLPLTPFQNLKDEKHQIIEKLPEQKAVVSDYTEFAKDYITSNKEDNQNPKSK